MAKSSSVLGKCVGIVFVILLSVIVVQFLVLFAAYDRRDRQPRNLRDENECRTPECLYLSEQFRSSMNLEVDPCDNFYEYACGHFDPKNKAERSGVYKVAEVLNDTEFGLRSRAEQLARQYFLSCTQREDRAEKELDPFLDYAKNTMGGLGESFNASQWTLQSTLEPAHLYKHNLLFSWDVSDDTRNSSLRVLSLERDCLNFTKVLQWQAEEGETASDVLERVFPEIGNETISLILQLNSQLEKIPKPPFDPDLEKSLTRFDISGLQKELPFLDWLVFFNRAFAEVNVTLDSRAEIIVEDLNYFKQLSKVIELYMETNEKREILASYLNLLMLFDFSGAALNVFNDGVADEQKEAACLDATKELLPLAVSAIYVREFVDKSAIAHLQTVADAVKYKFDETIASADWMDAKSLKITLEKVKQIRMMIGYQEFILDRDAVDSKYTDLSFKAESFFGRVLEGRLFLRRASCKELRAPHDQGDLGNDVSPSEYNAFFLMSRNTVIIPAAYAQLPRYGMFFPRYAQFAIMGFTVGHELFHSLDITGRQFDPHGDLRQWWEGSTIRRFEKRSQCFVDQFASYSTHGMRLNGNETLGENLADFGGLKIAFKAYRSWSRSGIDHPPLPDLGLSLEKLFFVSFAQDFCSQMELLELQNLINNDEHTPNEFRVIGTLRNMPEFAEVFSCSNATAMNPPTKCDLW